MKGADELILPPGFRFHPTDDELVEHYLCGKCAAQPIAVPIIADIDLYKFDPWELPEMASSGEKEWYFFSPRDRKYPKGSRPNRAAGTGYWKATGADKPIGRPKTLGIKKALVFYAGKSPKGIKTNWIMHEYRLANVDRSAANNKNLKLDDWVLCRIYNKKGTTEKHCPVDRKRITHPEAEDQKPSILFSSQSGMGYGSPMLTSDSYLLHVDKPEDSMPRLHTDSSSSEQVPSPEEEVVHSEPNLSWLDNDFDFDFYMNSMDSFQDGDPVASQGLFQVEQMQDMLAYLQSPF